MVHVFFCFFFAGEDPHAAVQFGHEVRKEHQRQPSRQNSASKKIPYSTTRAIYIGERTGDGADANTLLYCDAKIAVEHTQVDVAEPWHEEVVDNARKDGVTTPEFQVRKRIIHPGEVNRIRTVMYQVVVTHTDSPELFVWDFSRQNSRGMDQPKNSYNIPDCTLVGHTKNAEYAMSVTTDPGQVVTAEQHDKSNSPDAWVASGGSDKTVLVWRLKDYETMGSEIGAYATLGPASETSNDLGGHTATVEAVSFCSQNRNLIASVGRDAKLLLWDMRMGRGAACVVPFAHEGDINDVDFGGVNGNVLCTGGTDERVKVWDVRHLSDTSGQGTPQGDYGEHAAQVNSVMWNRYVPDVFASSGDDGQVLIWNTSLKARPGAANVSTSPELLFRHVGHKLIREKAAVVDFQWLPDETDPWCLATVSELIGESMGSILQIWRMSSMLSSPREEISEQLRRLQREKGDCL